MDVIGDLCSAPRCPVSSTRAFGRSHWVVNAACSVGVGYTAVDIASDGTLRLFIASLVLN